MLGEQTSDAIPVRVCDARSSRRRLPPIDTQARDERVARFRRPPDRDRSHLIPSRTPQFAAHVSSFRRQYVDYEELPRCLYQARPQWPTDQDLHHRAKRPRLPQREVSWYVDLTLLEEYGSSGLGRRGCV